MQTFRHLLISIAALLVLSGCASSRKTQNDFVVENSVFWKVSGKNLKSSSYIYGTLHLMCKEDIIIPEKAKEAIRNADDVYFELDLDDPATSLRMMGSMKMKDGKTLQDIFTPDEYSRLERYFKDSFSTSISGMKQMKPFFLISLMYPKLLSCKKQSGVDMELLNIAKEQKKPIKGLESVEKQASVFDSIPYRMQAAELMKSLDSIQSGRRQFMEMIEDYRKQDLGKLMKMTEMENFGSSEYMDLLLDDRNKNWVEQMKKLMPGKKLFFAVGAGHLGGEQGLVRLLRKEGYQVTPVR